MASHTAAKAEYDVSKVTFDLTRLRARDMSIISNIQEAPSKSWDTWAAVLARVVVSAPGLEGDPNDPEAWLDVLKGAFEQTVQRMTVELNGKN
jgi:hypothetical protein